MIWVSEIMLQQTRIEAAKPYFAAFMKRFPSVSELAQASEEEVLKAWEGLGYYSRARNLHKAAKILNEQFGGELPRTKEELKKLPGFGDYTSAAVAAFAFQKKEVAVDGNLLRVYVRLNSSKENVKEPKTKKAAESFFLKRISADRPGDYLAALMDVGELICLPAGTPKCDECPLAPFCKAHAQRKEMDYPVLNEKKEKKVVALSVFLLSLDGKLIIHKREEGSLMGGLYEFPNGKSQEKPEICLENLGFASFSNLKLVKKAKHVFTHLIYEMDVYSADVSSVSAPFAAMKKEQIIHEVPMATCFRKLL